MTSTENPLATTTSTPAVLPRIALTPAGEAAGRLDGAWWPHSRELADELPSLAGAMAEAGVITRATVNPALWTRVPRRVPASGRLIKVGWFTEQDPHEIMLLSHGTGRWDLLVIPPETDPAAAQRMMEAAAAPRDARSAGTLVGTMGLPGPTTSSPEDIGDPSETAWESEGGHLRAGQDGSFTIAALG
ncbi:DUF5994 family protein [Yinghuangia soli]|uniref:DUF5994 family protein n=1 Tax=Yinghuangia soli TaxID=2908204 RepID=A0AA41Q7C0_9ACTN|nr:DUF5994 family protein [Yinghuangia soli]MCF2532853.1 DUF5994 family protein [Yinghuangia soli]